MGEGAVIYMLLETLSKMEVANTGIDYYVNRKDKLQVQGRGGGARINIGK